MKKNKIIVTIMLALTLLLTACGSEGKDEGKEIKSETNAQETEVNEAEQTTPKEEAKKPVIGFCNIAETAELHTVIKSSMERAAKEHGFELIYMNNKLEGQVAVSNADAMLERGIDVFIEFNVDASVAPTIMEKMDAAGVPVIAVDIAHPGAVYFGADNYGVGPIVGKYLGEQVQTEWKGEPDCLLVVEDSISGEAALARTTNIIEGFREIFPDFSDDKVFYIDGGQDTAESQEVVANFLAAHPNFTKMAVAPAHVTMTLGALAAIETANRQNQCILVSQGEYDYLEYLNSNPTEPEWEVFRASLIYNFKEYGDNCMNIAEKLLAGEEVEEEYYPEHYIIDRDNAKETFPEAFQ